jgi:flagellar assembly protein FliH
MSWFIDRTGAARTSTSRRWLPPALPAPPESNPALAAPALRFDEAELARVAAGLVDRTTRVARAEAEASPAARQAEALERAAAAFEAAVAGERDRERAAVAQIVALAAAIGRVLGPTAHDRAGLAALVAEMLAGLEAGEVRLAAAPPMIELIRPQLVEIAARAGFAGSVELRAEPRLAEGALRLTWPGGWLARDPEEAARQVAALLVRAPADQVPSQGEFDDQP